MVKKLMLELPIPSISALNFSLPASQLPRMATVKQHFPREGLANVRDATALALKEAGLENIIKPGQRVGITAGSRGIKNITIILKEVIQAVKFLGAKPFIIAAMGSHGGGTAEGQLMVLSELGITPEALKAPVIAETQCRIIAMLDNNLPVYVSLPALNCDTIIVVNRIKPHTSFHGTYESGLQKMLAIGLGGPAGAQVIHGQGVHALPFLIPRIAQEILHKIPVALGIAIIEDAYEQTKKIVALPPKHFPEEEEKLLKEARSSLPRLPVDSLDLLIVRKMGKNFSGTGMDTNVIGRLRIHGVPEPEKPDIKCITVLDLSEESNGNATGIGLADFTTRRLVDKINFQDTYYNVLNSTFVQRAMIPMIFPNDREAIIAALKSLGITGKARVMYIPNTLCLTEIKASEALFPELKAIPHIEITGPPLAMSFDEKGNFL